MHILYAVTTCSDNVYKNLFSRTKIKPGFQAQKYHRLLIEGLSAHAKVDVIANPPMSRKALDKAMVFLPREEEGGATYHYIPAIRNPVLKLLCVGVGTFFRTLFMAEKESAVVVDCLNRTAALAGLLAARLRGCKCVGIITDLPDMLGGSSLSIKMANFVIRHCTHYVLLTEAMNGYIQNPGKPYVILEGHTDITMREKLPAMEKKLTPAVCMYAGGISRQYGLHNLVEGFRAADIPGVRLHLYGPGDYVEELKEIAAADSRVHYGGMLLSSEVVEKEMEATLLVNPRPTHEEFVKYSFPSKTMEYMSTGTPVLTTVLPGMPKEYYPYVYFIEDETAEGIAKALKNVFSYSDAELFSKGCSARDFVLSCRNNVVQAAQIVEMLKN